jgi:sulfur carrier protein
MSLTLVINGQNRIFADLTPPVMLARVIQEMDLKGDRIAVELNGEIAQRARWSDVPVANGDRLEVVHFVGGGAWSSGISDLVGLLPSVRGGEQVT